VHGSAGSRLVGAETGLTLCGRRFFSFLARLPLLHETPTLPTVTIGGVTAKILFSVLVSGYAGEYQIDVQVPVGVTNGDNVPVVVTMMGASDTAAISIQPSSIAPPNE
jgi:uncharacterized protein (TIGR03437 family)